MTAPPTAHDTTVRAAPISAPPTTSAPDAPISAPPAAIAPAPPISAPPAGTAPAAPISAPPAATAPVPPISAPPAGTAPEAPISAPPAGTASAAPVSAAPGTSAPVSAPPAATAPEAPVSAPSPAEQGDPEQVLAGYRWRIDPETLREIVDDPDELQIVRRRLTEKLGTAVDNRARARLLSLRAVVSRVLGELDDALADARLALTYAEATGELRRIALAQARLGQVLRWRGEFVEADQLFARATSPELPDRLRAALHEHAGRSCVDQGRFMEACLHFERALDLRGAGDADLLDRVRTALDAIAERAAEGLGPYPRSRDEVLERIQPPVPARDGALWGYTDPEGELVVPARYAETQQFREGLAWVRRPETDRWSLIALTGTTVIEPSYLAVRPFSDGLAWVVRNAAEGWLAVDPTGDVVIPPGFADVRPFRRGVAAVRREGWGAVDRTGQIVVPTRYHSFRTALADGRYVDGFTDEGLAVMEVGGRHGVVDHTGAVLVPPVHPALVVHPVAFLVGTGAGRWGALDRRGNPLIDPVHRTQEEVLEEIERLLADTNPVL
ncbi:WG repeat-containing protein [Micromonospora musae]